MSLGAIISVLWVLFAVPATGYAATNVTITAEYRPSSDQPEVVHFTNTTSCSLPGATQNWCNTQNGNTPVAISFAQPLENLLIAGGDLQDEIYLRTPAQREIVLSNEYGEQHALTFNITGIGYQATKKSSDPSTLHLLAARSLANPTGNAECHSGGRNYTGNSTSTYFFWGVNSTSGATCYALLKEGTNQTFDISQFFLGYELKTDTPSSFRNGVYRGSLNLTLGPTGDISFGHSDHTETVTIHFEVTVLHAFKMQFPPDSDRLVLTPQGGWGQWLNSGRTPPSLKRDLPFNLTSSGPIKISLQCQYPSAVGCALLNEESGDAVPLLMHVTLPGLYDRESNEQVSKLILARMRAVKLYSAGFSHERRSWLHFEVGSESVKEMVKQPGSTWRGAVTLIFDADLAPD